MTYIEEHPQEYAQLMREMDILRKRIVSGFDRVNADIIHMTSRTGNIHSPRVSNNVLALMSQVKVNFHAQNEAILYLLEKHTSGYINGVNHIDTPR